MKKIILLSCIILCLTSCAQPSTRKASSLPSTAIPDSSSLISSQEPSLPIQSVDPLMQKLGDDLRDPTFTVQVDFAQELDTGAYGEPKSDVFKEEIGKLILESAYETTTPLEHGMLESETDPDCIQIEVVGKEHWTQINYYLLSDSYDKLAGKLYVEVTPSTTMVHDMIHYDLANATCYLYNGDVFQKTIDLIESQK